MSPARVSTRAISRDLAVDLDKATMGGLPPSYTAPGICREGGVPQWDTPQARMPVTSVARPREHLGPRARTRQESAARYAAKLKQQGRGDRG